MGVSRIPTVYLRTKMGDTHSRAANPIPFWQTGHQHLRANCQRFSADIDPLEN